MIPAEQIAPAFFRMSADPIAVLLGLMDQAAALGETFDVDGAALDLEYGPPRSERERAARWGWSRRQVRNLILTGTASPPQTQTQGRRTDLALAPARPEKKWTSPGPEVDHETANLSPDGGEVDRSGPEVDQPDPPSAPLSCIPPAPRRGAAPQGGPRDPVPKPPRTRGPAFEPPSQADVAAFAAAHSEPAYRRPDLAGEFVDHFAANGWRVGGRAPMRDWWAAWRNWCRRAPQFAARPGAKPAGPLNLAGPVAEADLGRALAEHGLTAEDFYRADTNHRTGAGVFRLRPEKRQALGLQ